MSKLNKTGKIALTAMIALALVVGVSFMPLEKWTGGYLKDFNLISDIMPDSLLKNTFGGEPVEEIDPELLKAQEQAKAVASTLDANGNALYTDTIISEPKPNRDGDAVVIEDYTSGEVGLYHLKQAIRTGRLARVTMVGDSYIEGDIFCQDLRAKLQDAYGGAGVGYVNMYSEFPGFRRSVKQGGNGWKSFAANKKGLDEYTGLSEHYFMPQGNALSTYQGVTALPHLEQWGVSRFLFIAPQSTTIMTKTGEADWVEHRVEGSPRVQCITVESPTGEFDVKTSDSRLIALGVWLDNPTGISLDNMSSRGFSGVTLTRVSENLCRQMSQWINYDLIILEFGINAMSANQTNYSVYSNRLVEVINHVRACYPGADVLLLGIGDRGQKRGGVVRSMESAPYMVEAQREAARRAHCLFWDTREAMGGEDAIVAWSADGRANKDYIHLTHKGGAQLGGLLFNAIQQMLNR